MPTADGLPESTTPPTAVLSPILHVVLPEAANPPTNPFAPPAVLPEVANNFSQFNRAVNIALRLPVNDPLVTTAFPTGPYQSRNPVPTSARLGRVRPTAAKDETRARDPGARPHSHPRHRPARASSQHSDRTTTDESDHLLTDDDESSAAHAFCYGDRLFFRQARRYRRHRRFVEGLEAQGHATYRRSDLGSEGRTTWNPADPRDPAEIFQEALEDPALNGLLQPQTRNETVQCTFCHESGHRLTECLVHLLQTIHTEDSEHRRRPT